MSKLDIGKTTTTTEEWVNVTLFSVPFPEKIIGSKWEYPKYMIEEVIFDYRTGYLTINGVDDKYDYFSELIRLSDITSIRIVKQIQKKVTVIKGYEEDGSTPIVETQVIGPYSTEFPFDKVRIIDSGGVRMEM